MLLAIQTEKDTERQVVQNTQSRIKKAREMLWELRDFVNQISDKELDSTVDIYLEDALITLEKSDYRLERALEAITLQKLIKF